MARQPTPPPAEIIEFRTTDEIDRGIRKLERRISAVEALKAGGVRHRDHQPRWLDRQRKGVHAVERISRLRFVLSQPRLRKMAHLEFGSPQTQWQYKNSQRTAGGC